MANACYGRGDRNARKGIAVVKCIAADTRTDAQKHSLYELLKELTAEYPQARIMGHCELPGVAKKCPCYLPSKEYADLQPKDQ